MVTMASNSSILATLPPLPEYSLQRRPDLLPFIDDMNLSLLAPVLAYWVVSVFWHIVDVVDLFPKYRLHTPAEILKRNHAGRWEVFRDVILQQIIQSITVYFLNMTEPDEYVGREGYDIAVWAQRLRLAQRAIPSILSSVGLDAAGISKTYAGTHPMLSGALAGGLYPGLVGTGLDGSQVAQFAAWELVAARAIYGYVVPALQFFVAICILDTWQYFLHRGMHMNKYLYTTFHSRHHRLYVPYAYGALYNHPFEGFLLDTLGAALAFKATGMTVRQGMCFFVGSTVKTIDDHCGYALPWDPLQLLTGNNASYHDVHHQSWGVKTNFSQPFFTFWDRLLGTKWTGADLSAKYERARLAAQRKVDEDKEMDGKARVPSPSSSAAAAAAASAASAPSAPSTAASSLASDGMKGLRERVGSKGHSRKGSMLGMNH